MIRTEQPSKYDKSVDANCTLDEYILSNYAGLPNESMLEEQWNALPPANGGKPIRIRWLMRFAQIDKPARFFMNRHRDETGVSGTGKVLNGVIMPSGKVILEWNQPHETIGIYDNFEQFYEIHVQSHPDVNEVVFID